ncbi:UPF0303 protein [Colletotrichum siamense]|uniref:UPF0303 protein n=1 Tax=Colletotrichum siamense TaxID=690259 RepID=A0A9P5F526_COLSI|nr:UPF0303 protein [Colletotrichum siamense]KAF4856297.1 UPF0303 protein [Colletotrichum siamense]KAF4866188.1 UPF0303 protein [Colletotrichum siamense]KAF5494701.1 UPF0303 protein [Colletotrichum siamense]
MPPGRPKFDLEPFKGEITEAWNRRETNESIIKSLAAKGVEVNQKTFQRRLREWGLYRYNNKGAGKVRTSGARKVATPTSAHARPPVVRTPAEVQRGAQEEIPDSIQDDSPSSSTPGISVESSPERSELASNSYTLRASTQAQPTPASMSQKVWTRRNPAGFGLEKSLEAVRNPAAPNPIPSPPSDVDALKQDGDSFTLSTFTSEDAFELGHLLYARLLPFAAAGKPTVISIALANSGGQVLFQTAVGSGSLPDNETWVQRKRASVLRWGASTWLLHNKFAGDEAAFAARFGMSTEQAGKYAIHGGGVPIRVQGVEGVVAVVVVSGLKQDEDHGVIVDVIKSNWQ